MSLRVASAGGTATGEEGRRRLARPRSVIAAVPFYGGLRTLVRRTRGLPGGAPALWSEGGDGPEVRTRAAPPTAALPTAALSSWVHMRFDLNTQRGR